MEDAQTPDNDVVKEYFPNDDGGYLRKVSRWYEFAPFLSGDVLPASLVSEAMIMPYTTTAGLEGCALPLHFRVPHHGGIPPTTSLTCFPSWTPPARKARPIMCAIWRIWRTWRIGCGSSREPRRRQLGLLRLPAADRTYTLMSAHSATKWTLMMFDFNLGLGAEAYYPPGQNLFTILAATTTSRASYKRAATFRRMYWRALAELVSTALSLSLRVPLLTREVQRVPATALLSKPPVSPDPWIPKPRPGRHQVTRCPSTRTFSVTASVPHPVACCTGQAPFPVDAVWILARLSPDVDHPVPTLGVTVPLPPAPTHRVVGVDRQWPAIGGATAPRECHLFSEPTPRPLARWSSRIHVRPPPSRRGVRRALQPLRHTTFDLSGWQSRGLSYTLPERLDHW